MGRKVDLTGQRFGKWTVFGDSGKRGKSRSVIWTCVCDCGVQKDVYGTSLTSGKSTSCGCNIKKDIVGYRFGRLVVINEVGRKHGRVLWECVCDCGKHVNATSNILLTGNVESCGCTKIKDLSGQRFGKLVVLNYTDKRSGGSVIWRCKCDCGNHTEVASDSLSSGMTKSCGCLWSENLEGKRFGKLLVTERTSTRSGREVVWKCLCDCGNYTDVVTGALNYGKTNSCGCLRKRRGQDNPNYNPNLTDEERIRIRGHVSVLWSQQVMERDNYTCQICGDSPSGKLNAHHLNGWNAFPEQRFDLDNGVTLCTDCHKEFHSQYGYGDNTREQFDEYAESKTLVLN